MNTEQELRPCPFCGTSNKLKVTPYRADDDGGEPFDWGFTVICSALGLSHAPNRGCGASGAWGETEAEAIAAWNRRAPAVAAGGVTEERIEAAARALAARAFARVSTSDKADQIVDKGWIIYADDARAALTAALAVGDEGIREALARIIDANDDYLRHNPHGEPDALTVACDAARRFLPTPPSRGERV